MPKQHFFTLVYTFLACAAIAQDTHEAIVHFDFNSFAIKSSEKGQLDSLCAYLHHYAANVQHVIISGHCDSTGSGAVNDTLANHRAAAVKNYLVECGVEPGLMTISGYGKRKPLNDNGDSLKQAMNRRVEIVVYLAPQKPVLQTAKTAIPVASTDEPAIDLGKMKADSTIVLENINFYPDSHYPLSGSYPHITALLKTMKENPALKIEVRGFVCCLPATQADAMDMDTYTPDLSMQRAKFIYSYLVYHGIDSARLLYHGYGGSHPLVKELTDEDRSTNRRVEIKILHR